MPSTNPQKSREVNNLLHTLRGEQFRQLQNLRGSRIHSITIRSHNAPTLPVGLTLPEYELSSQHSTPSPPSQGSYSGPAPPKSWRHAPGRGVHDTPTWRAKALSLVGSYDSMDNFTDPRKVPSLALLCLQMILVDCTSKRELQRVTPFIPPHLRRDLIRHCAIHSPLPEWKLYTLFNVHGHADGEIIIVGPSASLRDQHFLRHTLIGDDTTVSLESSNWEEEDPSSSLETLVLVSTRLSTSTLLTFPPTLTHLALIDISTPVSLHRLPKLCPLLVVLDLSYNHWLNDTNGDIPVALDKIEWSRWSHLQVVGLRDCKISPELTGKINKGRWDDVNIVR